MPSACRSYRRSGARAPTRTLPPAARIREATAPRSPSPRSVLPPRAATPHAASRDDKVFPDAFRHWRQDSTLNLDIATINLDSVIIEAVRLIWRLAMERYDAIVI